MVKININTKKTDIQLNDHQEQAYLKKLQKVQKFFKNEIELVTDFEVGRITNHHEHGNVYFAKAHITIPGNEFYAESSNENVDLAFNEMLGKLKSEVSKYKEKKLSDRRKNGKIKRLFRSFRRD
ncbi:MAG: HPF/RaiA family ribosome-associated protein [Candidatus Buchananbacteria bacterium]|nr:HPF/RaiA family ribosome-associated protein [Candidatus Buchananbacteria bacterium]